MGSAAMSRAPAPFLLGLEWRLLLELGAFFGALPQLRSAPRGDGHPVLVIPGFGADDGSTWLFRRYLRDRGYSTHAWQLDGIFARELARHDPAAVRCVITLGSSFAGDAKSSSVSALYRFFNHGRVGTHSWARRYQCLRHPFIRAATAWCPGSNAWSSSARWQKTWRFSVATRAWAGIRRRCGSWQTAWRSRRGRGSISITEVRRSGIAGWFGSLEHHWSDLTARCQFNRGDKK